MGEGKSEGGPSGPGWGPGLPACPAPVKRLIVRGPGGTGRPRRHAALSGGGAERYRAASGAGGAEKLSFWAMGGGRAVPSPPPAATRPSSPRPPGGREHGAFPPPQPHPPSPATGSRAPAFVPAGSPGGARGLQALPPPHPAPLMATAAASPASTQNSRAPLPPTAPADRAPAPPRVLCSKAAWHRRRHPAHPLPDTRRLSPAVPSPAASGRGVLPGASPPLPLGSPEPGVRPPPAQGSGHLAVPRRNPPCPPGHGIAGQSERPQRAAAQHHPDPPHADARQGNLPWGWGSGSGGKGGGFRAPHPKSELSSPLGTCGW